MSRVLSPRVTWKSGGSLIFFLEGLAFGQHSDEARGSVWSYVAAHGTDKEGMRGILLDKFTRPSSEDLSVSNMKEITPVPVYGAATPGTWG